MEQRIEFSLAQSLSNLAEEIQTTTSYMNKSGYKLTDVSMTHQPNALFYAIMVFTKK